MTQENQSEKRVWGRFIKTIAWDAETAFGVTVERKSERKEPVKLQIFELTVAAIFARLRPDFEWSVRPVSRDEGADFIGRGNFFQDGPLEIQAAIRVGGQCKKHNRVDDAVVAIESGMTRMARSVNPTFFVVALSARLGEERLKEAIALVESERRRHCYVFQRKEIESLIHAHLPLVVEILQESARQKVLKKKEVKEAVDYFSSSKSGGSAEALEVTVSIPRQAGLPLKATVRAPLLPTSTKGLRLFWRPGGDDGGGRGVTLLDPIGADQEEGVEFEGDGSAPDLIGIKATLELLTYSVGKVNLGEILVGPDIGSASRVPLPDIHVGENIRPRFYDPPFRANRVQLEKAQSVAQGVGVATVGVVGAGGSGKSRLCEEFAFDQVRRGSVMVSARQAKILDDPYRLLADLFSSLVDDDFEFSDPAERVIQAIERYDPLVADRAGPALRAIFGTADQRSGTVTDQNVLAALVVLIVAKRRRGPVVIHLQDLHWCSVDVLLLLENLVRELKRSAASSFQGGRHGVLFIFEGRVQQLNSPGEEEWSSEHFEALLRKLDCPIVRCAAFDPDDSLTFVRLLFESRNPDRRDSPSLAKFEDELVESIVRSAGGNPFHSLEQVRILIESGVLGQNPQTGLLYQLKPESGNPKLPPKVFDSIQLRWRYLQQRTPDLALLIWAAALLEDRIPFSLFRQLRETLAPGIPLREVDATDMLWTGEGQEREVAFRHEHYFRSVKQFEVAPEDRERVVQVYSSWLGERDNPTDRFRHARALLSLPKPDVERAQELLRFALAEARQRGNNLLARRIATTSLDLEWEADEESPAAIEGFLHLCDEELKLIRELLGSDRSEAGKRLEALTERLRERLGEGADSPDQGADLQRRQLTARVLRSQLLYNNGHPAEAADVAVEAVDGIKALRAVARGAEDEALRDLEMEGLHSQGSALALSGEIDAAIRAYGGAVEIAKDLSTILSHQVVSTYANVLLAKQPSESETILRARLAEVPEADGFLDARQSIEINLGMTLLLRAHGGEAPVAEALGEARELLEGVYARTTRAGRFPTASAAALLIGIVDALEDGDDSVSWFTEAVIAASRGHKIETLWRARVNLAAALHAKEGKVTDAVRDNARAALETMEATLAHYASPGRSPRFELIRRPMAQAVSYLVIAGDETGGTALVRYPELREAFVDLKAGALREEDGADSSHEWLGIGDEHYVIY